MTPAATGSGDGGVARAVEARLRDLEDRACITDVIHRYGEGVRTHDIDTIVGCFTEGAVIDHSGGHVIEGTDQIRRYFQASLLSGDRPTVGERTLGSTPLMANVLIELEGDRACCESMCLAVHVQTLRGHTRVLMRGTRNVDDLERTAAGWRIRLRRHPSFWAFEVPGTALADLVAPRGP